jgi:hypothetical protein
VLQVVAYSEANNRVEQETEYHQLVEQVERVAVDNKVNMETNNTEVLEILARLVLVVSTDKTVVYKYLDRDNTKVPEVLKQVATIPVELVLMLVAVDIRTTIYVVVKSAQVRH